LKIDLKRYSNIFAITAKIGDIAVETGTDVYLVGGSVRDFVMGREVTDLDFVVIGDGIEFADRFARKFKAPNIIRYKRFGTALIPFHKFNLEFVGARAEEYKSDSRNPIVRKATLESDLARRDFTVNTLAMHLVGEKSGEIIDRFGGLKDIERKIIRTPLDPEQTFFDDPLRILRAVRFAAQLGFYIEDKTLQAIAEMGKRLEIISMERIAEEFKKLLVSPHPVSGLRLMDETGLFHWIIPELELLKGTEEIEGRSHKDIFEHTLQVVKKVSLRTRKFYLLLAALLHDIGKPESKEYRENIGWVFYGHEKAGAQTAERILQRMRYSGDVIRKVKKLVLLHSRPGRLAETEVTDSAVRRLIYEAGDDLEDLLLLSRSDISTSFPEKETEILRRMDKFEERLKEIEEKDHIRNFKFPINGKEIAALFNISTGPLIGTIKDEIREAILDGKVKNEKEEVIRFLEENKSRWTGRENELI
jgi:putative nucleotidyltransferase with HDIG domain